jgi:hypothetical protein
VIEINGQVGEQLKWMYASLRTYFSMNAKIIVSPARFLIISRFAKDNVVREEFFQDDSFKCEKDNWISSDAYKAFPDF